jgi:hypothetical protein
VLFGEYTKHLGVQMGRLQQVLDRDLAAFNTELRRLRLEPIQVKCVSCAVIS